VKQKPKLTPNRRSLPVDSSYEAGLQSNSSRKSDDMLGNCELPNSQKETVSEESQINRYYQINMKNPAEFEIDPTSTDEKPDDIECEDETTEAKLARRESLARSKTLILGVLISGLALCGMWILAKSSCGGSLSFKLFPPELQLNTGSCAQVEQTPQQSVSKN
jgi:hypothetical protein